MQDEKGNNTYLAINTDEPYAEQIIEIMKQHGHWGRRDKLKKEYGLIGEYLYGRIFGKGDDMILDIIKNDLRIYWCLEKVEIFVDGDYVPFLNTQIENISGAYARVPKSSFPLLRI